jgi:hypothetical protein
MWPIRFELDPGESQKIPTPQGIREMRLLEVREHTWADFYCDNSSRQSFAWAEVAVEVDGVRAVLLQRPYEMPVVVNGLRLYVETTRNWALNCQLEGLNTVEKTVRFSALAQEEDWGPQDLIFPVAGFRWRSSPYNNTWSALVPYNLLYYHRGEDYGAIPDRLDVLAVRAGVVVQSPHSRPQSSNGITILCDDRMAVSYYHMNLESIRLDLLNGTRVAAGEIIAKTGETWDGRKCQDLDPHLHVEFEQVRPGVIPGEARENLFSPYSFLVAAYLRQYPDRVLAQAGGHSFSLPGEPLWLDGSRSLARPGEEISSYAWHLADGRIQSGQRVEVCYSKPGLYAEELRVTSASGAEDRDYALVRVYEPGATPLGWGFCYHSPPRGIRPGTDVLFWNRLLANVSGPVRIDFGDGDFEEAVGRETHHAYRRPGIYTSCLSARGPHAEPLTLKMRVVVEEEQQN